MENLPGLERKEIFYLFLYRRTKPWNLIIPFNNVKRQTIY